MNCVPFCQIMFHRNITSKLRLFALRTSHHILVPMIGQQYGAVRLLFRRFAANSDADAPGYFRVQVLARQRCCSNVLQCKTVGLEWILDVNLAWRRVSEKIWLLKDCSGSWTTDVVQDPESIDRSIDRSSFDKGLIKTSVSSLVIVKCGALVWNQCCSI